MPSLHDKSAHELLDLIRSKQISPVELVEETIKRIEAVNPDINAFVSLRADQALEEAKSLTARITAGEDIGPLAGIPIGVKDLENVKGMATTFGSPIFKENIAQEDAIHIARLKAAGAIIIGKTNTPEFGYTFFTKNRLYGVTRNPWNLERTPGGSSGGSAAAIVGGMVAIATGSDSGGSIRAPAAYTGCYGLKTSFGRIPLVKFPGPQPLLRIHPISVLGPLTGSVKDAAIFLDCVAGYHPADPLSLPPPAQSYSACLDQLPSGLKIAFSPTLGYARVHSDVMEQVETAIKCFEALGHNVELWEKALPDVSDAWIASLNCDFYAQMHQVFEENRQDVARGLGQILEQTRSFALKDQINAQKAKTELNRILWELFDQFDLLVTPTMPTEAFAAKGPPPAEIEGHPISVLGSAAFNYPFNYSGHPAASVPAGLTRNGLPVGMQIIGPRHRDDLVLQASYSYEQARPWKGGWPEIT